MIRVLGESDNVTPLSLQQLGALGGAVTRELLWGLRAVSREVGIWRSLALSIPDPAIRKDALDSLERKRGHTDGAALFWILPHRRNPELLRLLVAYEIIWDFLDNVSERGAARGVINGRQLHLALIDALDVGASLSDYYRYHPHKDDGGYLRTLIDSCRQSLGRLPSYDRVRPELLREARRAQVLALNHEPDPKRRETRLKDWARQEFPTHPGPWYELSGAASASLTVHALLALAANTNVDRQEIDRSCEVYFHSLSLATTMLDSYVDRVEDAINGDHSYVAHYPSAEAATRRMHELVRLACVDARSLPHGHRHAVIVTCMVAMYLSKDSARTPHARSATASIIAAGGALARLLGPILRTWRTVNDLRAA